MAEWVCLTLLLSSTSLSNMANSYGVYVPLPALLLDLVLIWIRWLKFVLTNLNQ